MALRGIYRRDVSSNLETTGQSRDWVLRRKVSSSDETAGARVFIAGQYLALVCVYFKVISFYFPSISCSCIFFFLFKILIFLLPLPVQEWWEGVEVGWLLQIQ